jgi:hypothetical protein
MIGAGNVFSCTRFIKVGPVIGITEGINWAWRTKADPGRSSKDGAILGFLLIGNSLKSQ